MKELKKSQIPIKKPDNNFIAQVGISGDSLVIRIPKSIREFESLQQGDWLKIWIKKIQKKEE